MSTNQFDLDFSGRFPIETQIGMAKADENASEKWKKMWDGFVLVIAKRQQFLTSDDVLAEYEKHLNAPGTHNLSAIGPAMQRAAVAGILKATERMKRSDRPKKHSNAQRVWESLYWTPF